MGSPVLQVKREVNALYTELEIEIDGVFKTMLLLKKKKYAALMIKENKKTGEITLEREAKGLDMVRRDWSAISHDVGYYILNQILSLESREDLVEACHEYVHQVLSERRPHADRDPLLCLAGTCDKLLKT